MLPGTKLEYSSEHSYGKNAKINFTGNVGLVGNMYLTIKKFFIWEKALPEIFKYAKLKLKQEIASCNFIKQYER